MAIRVSNLTRAGLSSRTAPGVRGTPPGTTDPCPPPCPACGGLECLCRPRFFAGQLLTDQDLNRLDYYIRGKNRLHNRHLHGWGVVCGLEVTCHDCDDSVRVSPGYALSPCGDDIVVCQDDVVNVCKLIRACDPQRRRAPCDPPRPADPGCLEGEETWVLGICYAEHASRGVSALRATGCACGGGGGCGCGGAAKGGGCGCGGAAKGGGCGCGGGATSGGCGCGSHANGTSRERASSTASPSRASTQCEPSVICEAWEYRVWREPMQTDDPARGPLVERVICCIQPYLDWAAVTAAAFSADLSQQQQNRVCCQARERLRGILQERPVHNCGLLRRLDSITCPSPNDPNFAQAIEDALLAMVTVWFEALMACFCSALLPPCPGPQSDNCVPLATVTVRRTQAGCRVLRVCNWSVHRKFATTFPALQYWLSVLPFGRFIREAMEELCCNLSLRLGGRDDFVPSDNLDGPGFVRTSASTPNAAGQPPAGAPAGTPRPAGFQVNDPLPFASAHSREMSTLLASIALGTATPVDPMTLFRGLAGRNAPAQGADPAGSTVRTPRLTSLERDHLPQYLLASQLVPSALAGLAPHDLESLLPGVMGLAARAGIGRRGGGTTTSAPAAGGADVEALRRELTELRAGMEAQQRTIQSLTERLDNR